MVDIQAISSGLHIGDDGIWYSSDSQSISYPTSGNESCFAVEESSFWFNHRNNCIRSVVQSFPPVDNGAILDIGGGNGFVALELSKAGFDVVLLEPGHVGATNAKKRGISNVICATTDTANIKPTSLSAVSLFDVIEHIEHDTAFLQSIRALMKQDGLLYATVPAFSFLWSQEDVMAGHFRRYTIDSLSQVLRTAGFEVVFSSYIFRLLPLPIVLFRTIPYKLGLSKQQQMPNNMSRDHVVKNSLFVRMLNSMLQSEIAHLDHKRAMNFGGSCLIVARCS